MTRSRPPTRSRCSCRTCGASSRRRVSRACCTRSGEPATSFAHRPARAPRRAAARISASFDRLPIRTRLAGVSALLTFVILCVFAVAIGSLTVHRVRSDFDRQVSDTAEQLRSQLSIKIVRSDSREAFAPIRRWPSTQRRPTTRSCASSRCSAAQWWRRNHRTPRRSARRSCVRRRSTATAYTACPESSRMNSASRSAKSSSSTAGASPTPKRQSRASSCSCCSACSPGRASRCSPAWRSRAGRWRRSPS